MAKTLTLLLIATLSLGITPAAGAPQGQVTFAAPLIVPEMLDPAETTGTRPFMTLYAIHDAVVKPMPGNPLEPCLAQSWSVSSDGRVYEFVLRPNLRFHNGDPVTAADVKFSFERYRGEGSLLLRTKVARVQVVDALRVRFHLTSPWADFMTFYASSASSAAWVVPRKHIERVGEEGFRKHPIGAGPYRFVAYKSGVLTLEAWEGYWRTTPNVKTLSVLAISDEARRLGALKRRQVDVAYGLTPPVAEQLQRTPGLTLVATSSLSTIWLPFPEQWDRKSPWSDKRVRLAANLAIDREAINRRIYLGLGKPTASLIPSGMAYFWNPPPYAFDQDKARQLLRDAGYPEGFDGGELVGDATYDHAIAESLAGDLQAVGIRVKRRLLERIAFFKEQAKRKPKALVLTQSGMPGNVATRVERYVVTGGYYTYATYQDIDGLFSEQAVEIDPANRQKFLTKIQQVIHERAMFAPIIEPVLLSGVGPRLEVHGLGLIANHPYAAPYEELKLKGR